jgi:hypothetical protein
MGKRKKVSWFSRDPNYLSTGYAVTLFIKYLERDVTLPIISHELFSSSNDIYKWASKFIDTVEKNHSDETIPEQFMIIIPLSLNKKITQKKKFWNNKGFKEDIGKRVQNWLPLYKNPSFYNVMVLPLYGDNKEEIVYVSWVIKKTTSLEDLEKIIMQTAIPVDQTAKSIALYSVEDPISAQIDQESVNDAIKIFKKGQLLN